MRICEIFDSIQGEGLTMGLPTTFVRTVGCNLRCAWCDTGYSFDGGDEMSVDDVVKAVGDARLVCLTGGEPMLQEDSPELIRRLTGLGKRIVLETNGSMDLTEVASNPLVMISMDIKCPSSGMTDRMLASNMSLLTRKDQLKFIVDDDADFDFALGYLRDHPVDTNLVFGPVGGTVKLEWLVGRVMDSGLDARVLPQLHKIIWGDRRSV